MSFSGIPESTASQLTMATAYNDNSYCEGSLGLGGFSYLDPSNIAGPSQPYFGVDVWGDFNNYPDFATPSSAPTSLLQVNRGYPSEGKSYFILQLLSLGDSHANRRVQLLLPGHTSALLAIAATGDHTPPRSLISVAPHTRTDPFPWL